MITGILVLYGTLAAVTTIAIATSDGGGNYDPYTDDPSF